MSKPETFAAIYQRACERKGSEDGLECLLPKALSPEQIRQKSDASLLSAMSMQVFQSGFIWRIVENKWSAYEQAFFGFEPFKVLMLSPEQLQAKATDVALIRHQRKTQAIYDNALMVNDIQREQGSFADFIAAWDVTNITGLWQQLKRRGSRLGGNTGPYFLRRVGKDTFLLTPDIQGYFTAHKLVDTGFSSKSALTKIQATFNDWQQESGRQMCEISAIIAYSVGDNKI